MSFMLKMLRQKLERIPIVEISIVLAFLSHPRTKPDLPIFQRNGTCSTGEPVPYPSPILLCHIVQGSHPKHVGPSDSPPDQSRLKNLVKCCHWFNVWEFQGMTFRCSWERRTICWVRVVTINPQWLVTKLTTQITKYPCTKRKWSKTTYTCNHQQNLWSVGHYSNLTISKNKHRPLGAQTKVPAVIKPTSPPQYHITI